MAQTLKFGNKTWATKVGSTLAYNDENGNYKPLPFAFTRSTSATRVNKEGLIEVVTNDRPRIDYTDTSDGVLLLEKAATNFDSESENFATSYMSNSFGIQSSNLVSDVAPDGTTNSVFKISKVTGSSDPYIGRSGVPFTSTNIVFSVWLWTDSDQPKDVLLLLYRDAVAEIATINITLTNTPTRYFIQKTFSNTPSSVSYRIDLTPNSSNQYIYAWGKQVESGNVASSYIPTQGSATTRVAETASGAGNSEVFNDSEGVLFADIAANADDGTYRVFGLSDGTTNNRIILYYNPNSNNIELFISSGGAAQATLNLTLTDIKLFQKVAVKYKVNDIGLWINGFEVGTDSSATMPTGLNELAFDNSTGAQNFYGKTKEIGYYNTILTDLELETLTSYKSWTSMVNELNLNIIYNG